jgi:hypothetical protein
MGVQVEQITYIYTHSTVVNVREGGIWVEGALQSEYRNEKNNHDFG